MLPTRRPSFRISRPAVAIVVAAFLLAALLATLTVRNIRREQRLMRNFLTHEGLTLIRAFEAGARTTMMHRMRGDDPLADLVAETVKEPSVAYIRVVDGKGAEVAAAGRWPVAPRPELGRILAAERPLTTVIAGEGVFEVASRFTPVSAAGGMGMMRWRNWNCGPERGPMAIYLGLRTDEFDRARRVDVRHALLLGGILFLVGSAGFYFIFVYQEMRVARRTLADMELYTENVIESLPAGLVTVDAEGRVVSANRRAGEIIGRPVEEIVGRRLDEAVPACPVAGPGEELVDKPFVCEHGDGTAIPVRVSASTLHDRAGRVNGMVIIVRDVREIQEIEEKLEQSRRLAALGRMAAGIAHEIRNPLGTLRGFAQLFVRKFSGRPEEQQHARMMVEEVDRLNRTVSALLQFARPREPEMQEVDLGGLAARAAGFMADEFAAKGIDFRLDCGRGVMIEADPDLLRQLLLNLLHNALAATESGGRVEVAVEPVEAGAVLRVSDTGCGMSPGDKARMFDPFFSRRKGGTGLGLAVAHQIITAHRGEVSVDSEPGRGTVIEVVFPGKGKDEKNSHS